jgi:aspartate dehydrogenase
MRETSTRRASRPAIGLIGAGTIGGHVLDACADGSLEGGAVVVLVRTSRPAVEERLRRIGGRAVSSVDDLLAARPDVVLEAAGHSAVRECLPHVARAGVDAIVMSIGALGDDALRARLEAACRSSGATLSFPSGGVGGLDALAAARARGGLETVTHRTIKHPDGLKSAPYVIERGLLQEPLPEPAVIYRGSAREATHFFPQNINIAAAVSLAGIGFDRTQVEIVADPSAARSVHEIRAVGNFGTFTLRFENVVEAGNPRTSKLAALSAVAALQRRAAVFKLT